MTQSVNVGRSLPGDRGSPFGGGVLFEVPACRAKIRRNAGLWTSGFGTYFMLCAPGRPLRRPRAPRGGERAIFASVCGKIGKCWKTVSELPAFLSGGFSTTGRKTRLPRFFRVLHSFHRVFHRGLHFSTGFAQKLWKNSAVPAYFPITEKKFARFSAFSFAPARRTPCIHLVNK